MTHQPHLIPDQPTPEQAARDAERAEYLACLREKLKDPEFRAIEGFPIGEDEDILALSDPPYYTACPNPFLPEILERWQAERTQIRQELGLPDDSADNEDDGQPVYHREPFAVDVSEGKGDPIYNAHGYHTKVPHKAVMRYILHYTDPGDVVFDGFCGTGMTGVAAQLCSDRKQVDGLGYRVQDDGVILDEKDRVVSRLGARKAVLVDLSPMATFVAYNYNTPVNVTAFERDAQRIMREVEAECDWMYRTTHIDGKTQGRINYTVWSDVFICPYCGREMTFWDVAVDKEAGEVREAFPCPGCGVVHSKRTLERARELTYDRALGQTLRRAKQMPVLINYSMARKRYEKIPDADDLALIQRIEQSDVPYWFPVDRMPEGDESRRNDAIGMTHVHHFYSRRNLWVLAAIWHRLRTQSVSPLCDFVFTSTLPWTTRQNRLLMSNYFHKGGGVVAPTLPGTLYVSSLGMETNPMERFGLRVKSARYTASRPGFAVGCQSATVLSDMPADSIDYAFVDPPFGENLMYSELNFLTESWLRLFTDTGPEAIINRTQGKNLVAYLRLMEAGFLQCFRLLKRGHWMTVEFHNSKNTVWNSIQEAILRAGFVIADVRVLEKTHKTFKQVTAANAVKKDLAITAYKPSAGFEHRFLELANSPEGAWAFVRQHLEQLPVVIKQDGILEIVAERQAYLLYDRMVAFHIQRGFSVPMGAAEFYAGLKQGFPERDSMYFLPDQAAEYDRERMQATKVEQLALFVTDEKSALQWLRRELDSEAGAGPQTYQDLQPKFLRELHQARHEDLPELSEMLAQSFLKDEQDRWYVPDPGRQDDLEKLRERALLREFGEYAQGKGRLKVFRTEAVRAGFKHAWAERDYNLIVKVAQRLPESVLQEDAGLLMYYDNALMRAEAEPVQGRLW